MTTSSSARRARGRHRKLRGWSRAGRRGEKHRREDEAQSADPAEAQSADPAEAPAVERVEAPAGDGASQEERERTHRLIMAVMPGLMAGMFLSALDQMVMSASIRTIADDLGGLQLQAWATTAYLITSTVTTPLYGKLSDIYGRKPLFVAAVLLFTAGSLACAAAGTMHQLALFRGLQGLGGGGLTAVAMAITADLVPPRDRARYQGMSMAVWLSASLLGPLVGGLFAGAGDVLGLSGWRWIFLINVPVAAVALVVIVRVLNVPHRARSRRIDHWGAAAITAGTVPLLLLAEQGQQRGWTSAWSLTCAALGVAGFLGFLLVERRMGADALIPLHLFRIPTFSVAVAVSMLVGGGMFGAISVVPLYLQIVGGNAPVQAGLMMLPMMAGVVISTIWSSKVLKRGGSYRMFPVVGAFVTGAGMFVFRTAGPGTPSWVPMLVLVAFGIGIGNCTRTLMVAAQNSVPVADIGTATASVTFFRQVAGVFGVALFLSVLFGALPGRLAEAADRPEVAAAAADPAVARDPRNAPFFEIEDGSRRQLDDSSFLDHADPRLSGPFREAFDTATDLVFLIGGGVMAVTAVLALFLKEVPLRELSAAQIAERETAAKEYA
ncbi:MDR family MFS transporter [Streptomyces sp. NPDC059175]|uniref:MDR family MFS transporter n=1 Tax=Streptomyces sp. NPDC059175 TaxID=3346757 RepID=UPI0036838EE9